MIEFCCARCHDTVLMIADDAIPDPPLCLLCRIAVSLDEKDRAILFRACPPVARPRGTNCARCGAEIYSREQAERHVCAKGRSSHA